MNNSLVIDSVGTYQRTSGTHVERVNTLIASKYSGCSATQIVTSGMNAIYLALNSVQMHSNNTFMFADELYCDTTTRIMRHIISGGGTCVSFDQTNLKETEKIVNKIKKGNISCMFFESCSNPSGKLIDWNIIKLLSPATYVVVDNTWLSPILCNPFDYGAHIVVESCTKYLSSGKCIAGHISFRSSSDLVARSVINAIKTQGLHVSPVHCDAISRSLDTLDDRIRASSQKTLDLYEKLKHNNMIIDIKFPFEMGAVTRLVPSVIFFAIKSKSLDCTKKSIRRIVESTGLLFETSFGGTYNKIDSFPVIKGSCVWLRLSVGCDINPPNDIVTLEKQLDSIIKNM
jgi:cystathionine beta-lyase/cystathionine gamma-synthase